MIQLSLRIVLLLSLLLCATSLFANDLQLRKGASFLTIRGYLLKSGNWKAVNVHVKDGYQFMGVEKKLKNHHIDEVESCAMDAALCIFNYRKNSKCLQVITRGEELSDMRVYSWSHRCPE